jgi:hypothetical protein
VRCSAGAVMAITSGRCLRPTGTSRCDGAGIGRVPSAECVKKPTKYTPFRTISQASFLHILSPGSRKIDAKIGGKTLVRTLVSGLT